ncbi:helix-turn-helix domain-containing protein, partial [Xylella fastidiosa]
MFPKKTEKTMNSVKIHNEIKITAKELTELAFSKSGETSIRGFAKRIGVSHTAVGNWIEGSTVPTFEQAAELATLAELPIIKTAANIRLQSIQGKKHKTLLKQLATTATTLLIGAGITCPSPSEAQSISKNFNSEVHIMLIMS